jgi:hypothetical protein
MSWLKGTGSQIALNLGACDTEDAKCDDQQSQGFMTRMSFAYRRFPSPASYFVLPGVPDGAATEAGLGEQGHSRGLAGAKS